MSAGEQSGHLDAVLERLADYTESRERAAQKVLGALLYPMVLTVMCFGIVSVLLVYVVPKVVGVFGNDHAKLPLMTRVLIAVSDFLRDYGLWLVLAVAGRDLAVLALAQIESSRRRGTVPAAARRWSAMVRGFNTARFTRTLSILTAAPCRCWRRCASPARWSPTCRCGTRRGRRRAGPRGRADRPVAGRQPPVPADDDPPDLQRRVQRRAGDHAGPRRPQPGARARRILRRSGLLGPLLIVVMGMFVMGIVFAMLLPIFEMNQLVK